MNEHDRDRESYEAPRAEDLDSEEGTVSTASGNETDTVTTTVDD
jgi:hypothetical protein